MTGADAEEEVGLAQEGEAEGFGVDGGGEFVLPGEDVERVDAGGSQLFCRGLADRGVVCWVEVLEEFGGLIGAEKEASEDAVFYGEVVGGVAEAVKTVDEGGELFAIAGAHLFVGAEEVFEPGIEGCFATVGVDDVGGVTELVVEFHGVGYGWGEFDALSLFRMRSRDDSMIGKSGW